MINKEIKENVTYLLRNFPETRDCDLRLTSMYWRRFDNCSDVLNELYNGNITHFESIRRMRQRLQQDNEDLRGTRYKVRKYKLEKEVREIIKN